MSFPHAVVTDRVPFFLDLNLNFLCLRHKKCLYIAMPHFYLMELNLMSPEGLRQKQGQIYLSVGH
jgi:hypothetical protein